jgi:hypothetical protein
MTRMQSWEQILINPLLIARGYALKIKGLFWLPERDITRNGKWRVRPERL